MGMYTEHLLRGEIRKDAPEQVRQVLRYMTDNGGKAPQFDLPDHPFFRCSRWNSLGCGMSFYFPWSMDGKREIHAPFTILMCGCESHGDPDGDCSECSISGRVLSSDSFSVTFAVQVSRELLADWEVSTE